jgi:hypothetical protein
MKNTILAALATLTLVACGGSNPRVYLVAADAQSTAPGTLPTSCNNDEVSDTKDVYTNLRAGAEWELWDGVDGKQYLDIGSALAGFNLIEGDGKDFNAQYVSTYVDPDKNGNTYTNTRTIAVNFSELGAAAQGTFSKSDSRTCSFADPGFCDTVGYSKPFSCAPGALPIVGRQVAVENFKGY